VKPQEKGEEEGCMERKAHIGNKGEGGWKKKIQRQDGKCRGEETDGMDRRKWMGGIERDQTRGRRRGMDLHRQQVGNSNKLRNGERRSTGKSRRIQNRRERESKIMEKFQHIKLTKESNESTSCNCKKQYIGIAITFL
jgi:hypothetical protein